MSFQPVETKAEAMPRFPGSPFVAPETIPSLMQEVQQDLQHGPARGLLPVLIVLHQETSTPGRIGNALRALGYPLDIRRPRFGDPLPKTLNHHAGVVIFGGPMSANDPDDYVRREIDWIAV